jgi:hypothetical protein
MSLPRNTVATHELTQPSTGKKVKYRPWVVGEQKNLLMALSGADTDILLAIRNAVDTCTFNKLDIANLPNFDLEYMFMQIRMRAVGESVDLILTCKHCDHQHEHKLNLQDVEVIKTPGHSTKIMLADNLGVEMNYPTTEQLDHLNKNYSVAVVYDTICQCIKTVFTDEEVHPTKDEPLEEVQAFLASLEPMQLEKIERFFATMPVLKHTMTVKCPQCEKDTFYSLEGIEAFFG